MIVKRFAGTGPRGFIAAPTLTPAQVLAAPLPGVVTLRDTMTRTPASDGPGSPDVGSYSADESIVGVDAAGLYSASGLEAIVASAARPMNRLVATIFSPDYLNYSPMIMVRYVDVNNFLAVRGRANGTLQIISRIAGAEASLGGSFSPAIQNGETHTILATWNGSVFHFEQDGIFANNFAPSAPLLAQFIASGKVAFGFRNGTTGPVVPASLARISNIQVYS